MVETMKGFHVLTQPAVPLPTTVKRSLNVPGTRQEDDGNQDWPHSAPQHPSPPAGTNTLPVSASRDHRCPGIHGFNYGRRSTFSWQHPHWPTGKAVPLVQRQQVPGRSTGI